ncbi:MAG: DNA repair protein RecN, partial [Eubacterium sp.]
AVLGERTSRELVRDGADRASVIAVFDDINEDVKKKLDEYDIDYDDSVVLTRKISDKGKTSCRINGVPCTVAMLHSLGEMLVNIHGQHDSQALFNPDYHYKFVDMYCDNKDTFADYITKFKRLVAIRKRLKALTMDADSKDKQLELLNYQIDELSRADIKIGERDELKQRKNLILNAQNIIEFINTALASINGDEYNNGVFATISTLSAESNTYKSVDEQMNNINLSFEKIGDDIEELKDLLSSKLQSVEFDEQELQLIDDRLDMYYHFSTKYGDTEEQMLEYLQDAIAQRDAINNSDEELERLNAEYDQAYNDTVKAAESLTAVRKSASQKLEQEIKEQLEFLDMPKIKFIVDFQQGNLSSTGCDRIEFLISTNPGEPPKPLAKIASGGELSRIMLAIKNIIARHDIVDTLIFDEIDTGVSGMASHKIGLKLSSVSEHIQVICVTHSAQIASVADTHFLIKKQFLNDRTYTSVKPLDYEERKYELARIMGGINITDTMLRSAEELLNSK